MTEGEFKNRLKSLVDNSDMRGANWRFVGIKGKDIEQIIDEMFRDFPEPNEKRMLYIDNVRIHKQYDPDEIEAWLKKWRGDNK